MKTTKKENLELALKLYKTIEQRKKLEKLEAELKESIKIIMGDDVTLIAGEITVSLDERSKTDLDKKLLKEEFGDKLKKFEKTITYNQMTVVKT